MIKRSWVFTSLAQCTAEYSLGQTSCAPVPLVTKQCNLVLANWHWCSEVRNVTACLAESNSSLLESLVILLGFIVAVCVCAFVAQCHLLVIKTSLRQFRLCCRNPVCRLLVLAMTGPSRHVLLRKGSVTSPLAGSFRCFIISCCLLLTSPWIVLCGSFALISGDVDKDSRTRTKDLSWRTEIKDFRLSRHVLCHKHKSFRDKVLLGFCASILFYTCLA